MKEETFAIGSVIAGTYKILDFIGQGGMGQVFKVEHLVLTKIMAMKVLLEEEISSAAWQRFRNEAQAIARLDHVNIIKIYDMNQTASGLPFYTMDFLSGQSLADRLDEDGRISMQEALPIFEQVCAGLGYAHDRGIIHRDIKPGNIMLLDALESEGAKMAQIKIGDFGIAKLLFYDSNLEQGLTKPGEVCGSPLYMSPEQSSGQKVDYRTDMYSVGVTMYQALTGKPPLLGKSAIETIALHQTVEAPPLSKKAPDLYFPPELEDIVARLLQKDPEQRYASLYDAAAELKTVALGRSATGRTTFPQPESMPGELFETTASGAIESKQRLLLYIPLTLILLTALYFGSNLVSEIIQSRNKPKHVMRTLFTDPPALVNRNELAPNNEKSAELEWTPPEETLSKQDLISIRQFIKQHKKMYFQPSAPKSPTQTFHFPEKFSLGKIYYGEKKLNCEAQGMVTVPSKEQLKLVANLNLVACPALLKFFQEYDLTEITLQHAISSPELARSITPLKGLSVLDFHYGDICDDDLNWIDKMPNLLHVTFSLTKITANNLAKTKFLQQLNALEIEHFKNITPVLKALLKSKNILFLNIGACKPTADDINLLAKSKTLSCLDLHENNISAEEMATVANMRLERLNLQVCRIEQPNTKTLEQLSAMKTLKKLTVPSDYFNDQQIEVLKEKLPQAAISDGNDD